MTAPTSGWFGGAVGSASPALPVHTALPSPQYGPAWVAERMYGITVETMIGDLRIHLRAHPERLDACLGHGHPIPDDVARHWFRVVGPPTLETI